MTEEILAPDLDELVGKKLLGHLQHQDFQYLFFEGGDVLRYFTPWDGAQVIMTIDEVAGYLAKPPVLIPDPSRGEYKAIMEHYNSLQED